MSKDTENETGTEAAAPDADRGPSIDRLPVVIHSQYIRDLSFENPNAPMPLRKGEGAPAIGVDFSMDARKLDKPDFKDAYEVVLYVSVKATRGEDVAFIAELEYGMMVSLQNVPEEKIHPLLLIEMTSYMFPYVRQIIATMTADAGYMPFYLTPVNFKALYRKQFGGQVPNAQAPDTAEAEEAAKQTA